VETVSPVLVYGELGVLTICAKVEQPTSLQRSIKYAVTATLSVDAVHVNVICVGEIGVAAKLPGVVGAIVSAAYADEKNAIEQKMEIAAPRVPNKIRFMRHSSSPTLPCSDSFIANE
jgi:hypothetical protein